VETDKIPRFGVRHKYINIPTASEKKEETNQASLEVIFRSLYSTEGHAIR